MTHMQAEVRELEPWYPPGVTVSISSGNTADIGLLPDGNVIKYVRDRSNQAAFESLEVEHQILTALGPHPRIVRYLGRNEHGLILGRAEALTDVYPSGNQDQPGDDQPGDDQSGDRSIKEWAIQTAEAVAYIHSKGVIHCDLHPNNLLIDGGIRLCDFAGSTMGNLDGKAMESVRYCLPRDWRTPPNEKTDLFALGSVLYFLLNGEEPYKHLSDDAVVEAYSRGEFPDTIEIIKQCWRGETTASKVFHLIQTY